MTRSPSALLRRLANACLAASLLACGASFAASEGDGSERAAITRDREKAEAAFVARDAECRSRFIVSSCLEDARRARREALDALRVRQLVVDEARRRGRAEERRAALAAQGADDAKRDRERAGRTAGAASAASQPVAGRPLEARNGPGSAPPGVGLPNENANETAQAKARGEAKAGRKPVRAAAKPTAAQRNTDEASHRAAYEARREEAARHRTEALDAAERRKRQHAPARPLPTPPAPSAAAARSASAP